MADMGAEVGQKMRSAIKAKLTELDCYVDDELPDYIMVMVANKRTKSQMNEDLKLFLGAKTSSFVEWLHIVLKKLKEVTVSNLDALKKSSKRKSNDSFDIKVKKEKKIKKERDFRAIKNERIDHNESLTNDLPLNVKGLSENRKIMVLSNSSIQKRKIDEEFDIPSLSQVQESSMKELEEIEFQIKNVKNRLGIKIDDEVRKDEIDTPSTSEKTFFNNGRNIELDISTTIQVPILTIEKNEDENKKQHSRIVFSEKDFESPIIETSSKKKSVLDRLGKNRDNLGKEVNEKERERNSRRNHTKRETYTKRNRSRSKTRNERQREKDDKSRSRSREGLRKNDVKNRLGLSSKITIPQIDPKLLEDTFKKREVVSVVKVKPRTLPPNVQQANKNLLLKAVAEAQKSIAQSRIVEKEKEKPTEFLKKPEGLFTKHYKQVKRIAMNEKSEYSSSQSGESSEDREVYIPKPVTRSSSNVEYIPSSVNSNEHFEDSSKGLKHQFIVTLDGIKQSDIFGRKSAKDRISNRKTPSPIRFDSQSTVKMKSPSKIDVSKIPDELPAIPVSKIKAKCKYFPSCKNGDECEFHHPTKNCEQFPYCKFGNNCHYIHPNCKFGSSCTRKDCSYSHSAVKTGSSGGNSVVHSSTSVCKFFPNCSKINCAFFHPKLCKFGKYCRNRDACSFSHLPTKNELVWTSR